MSPSLAVAQPQAPQSPSAPPDATPASWYGLAVLIVVALYGVVDRQVFVLMAEPIRVNLGLNDFQLGLLNGLGVSMFAVVAGYPIGWLADRYDRRVVLACCIVVWSLAVVACGMAQTFSALFLASAMVGAGEAGITPIMFSMIPEMFRNAKRQFANSLNMVVGRLSTGLLIAFCGLLSQIADASRPYLPAAMQGMENWRLTFFWAALPAPLFVLLLLWLPARSRAVEARANEPNADMAAPPSDAAVARRSTPVSVVAFWRAHATHLGAIFAALTVSVMGLVAVSVWLPVVAMRQFGATPVEVGNALGGATFVASAAGLLFTVYGMRWMAPRVGGRLPVMALAVACATSGLALLLLPLATSSNGLFIIYGLHMTLLMMGLMTYPTVLQDLAPAHLRARMFAIFGVLGVVFPSLMPPFIGALSDQFTQAPNGLMLVTVVSGAVLLVSSSALYLWGARGYEAIVRAAAEAA
jgi:MFS family permease